MSHDAKAIQLSNREQSETNRHGNLFCPKEIGIIDIIY